MDHKFWSKQRIIHTGQKWSPQKFQSDYVFMGSTEVKKLIFRHQTLGKWETPLMTFDQDEVGIKLKLLK